MKLYKAKACPHESGGEKATKVRKAKKINSETN